MKTRIDFVSNSSSCSFIIEEPQKFISFAKSEFDIDEFCSTFDSLTLSIKTSSANKDIIYQVFGKDINIYEYEDVLSIHTTLDKLVYLDNDTLNKLNQIELECDDYETKNVVKLSVLWRVLQNVGINVLDNTEHDLLFTDSKIPIMAKLYSLAFNKNT